MKVNYNQLAKHNPDIFHTKTKDGKPVRVNVVTLPLYGGAVNSGIVVHMNNKKFGHYSIDQLKDFANQNDEFMSLFS